MMKKGLTHRCLGECLNFKSYFQSKEKLSEALYESFAKHFNKSHTEARCLEFKYLPEKDKGYFRDQAKIVIFLFKKTTRPRNV